jgi:hypothetical protein
MIVSMVKVRNMPVLMLEGLGEAPMKNMLKCTFEHVLAVYTGRREMYI